MEGNKNQITLTPPEGEAFTVTACELTVQNIRDWMASLQVKEDQPEPDLVGEMLLPNMSFSDLGLMSDITQEQINTLFPTQLEELAHLCQKLNPRFFGMRGRLKQAGEEMLSAGNPSNSLKPSLSDSSSVVT